MAYRLAGRYGEQVELAKKAIERDPNDLVAHVLLISGHILAGREEEARAAAADVLRINPNFSVEQYAKASPFKDQSQIDITVDALRKAGLK